MNPWKLDVTLAKRLSLVFDNELTQEKLKCVFDGYAAERGMDEAERCFNSLFAFDSPAYADRSIEIVGSDPKFNRDSRTFKATNGRTFKGLSGILLLQYALAFLSSYDGEIENRTTAAATTQSLEIGKIALPYLVAYLAFRSPYMISEDRLSYRFGFFSLAFSTDEGTNLSRSSMIDALSERGEFVVLSRLGARHLDSGTLSKAFDPKHFSLGRDDDGTFLALMAILDASEMRKSDSKILSALALYGILNRQSIGEICQMPDRTVSDVLSKLIVKGKVERIGKPNSPLAKYKLLHL